MPAYNFQPRFADAVESGTKLQTMRKSHKGAKRGDTAYLYTGMRTKNCRKLGEGALYSIAPVTIIHNRGDQTPTIVIHKCQQLNPAPRWGEFDCRCAPTIVGHKCQQLNPEQADFFAQLDGFEDAQALYKWFDENHGLPFTGYVHKWILK